MAKERAVTDGPEEREVSDGSVEEISEEAFKHDGEGRAARVWRSSDYVQFPRYLSQNQMFSSFAWMQAVKNKPLVTYGYGQAAGGAEGPDVGKEEVCMVSDSGDEDGGAVEREEGELEEGEINDMGWSEVAAVDDALDAAMEEAAVDVQPNDGHLEEVKKERMPDGDGSVKLREKSAFVTESEETGAGDLAFVTESKEMDMELDEPEDFDQLVSSTLEDLEAITEEEVEKSFDGVCSKLLRASKRLQKMIVDGHGTYIDAIIQHAFMSLETIHSVYLKTKEKNKDVFARFVLCIQSLQPSIFVAEQMKEINDMVPSPDSEKINKAKVEQVSLTPVASSMGTEQIRNASSLHTKLPINKLISNRRGMEFGPLLDPHAVHDEDSLPSPTRETGPSSVAPSTSFLNQNTSQQANRRKQQHDKMSLPYVTDALKAVSSYHKKYDRISFFSNDQLPSPTPSEDGDNGDNDMNGEVSSTPSVRNMTSMDPSMPFFSSGSIFGSTGVFTDSSSAPRPDLSQSVNPISYGPSLVSKVSAKIRDPRLKLTGSTVAIAPQLDKQSMGIESDKSSMGSFPGGSVHPRKHKAIGGPAYSDHLLKRPRNDFVNANDSPSLAGRGGWLENNGSVHLQSAYPVPPMGGFGVENRKPENGGTVWGTRQDTNWEMNIASVGTNRVQSTSAVPPMGGFGIANRKPENGGSVWGTRQDTTWEMDIASVETNRLQSTSSVKDADSLLKDIAENPNLLLNLLKELPGLTAEKPKQPNNSAQNLLNNSIMQVPSPNISSKNGQYEQRTDGRTSIPGEVSSSVNPPIDAGKVRMKPRDPRRILQNSMIQKNEQLPSQHLKGNGSFTVNNNIRNDNASVRDDGEKAQTSASVMVPEFPKNPRINSNMLPTPQTAGVRPTAPMLIVPSNSTKIDGVVAKAVAEETNDPQSSSSLAGERMSSDASHSSDPWGDVDHLLDGYDDKQKAAIQRERARRIEEQNKMFAARKLSLVLDLDHTLLNSAKFAEVDPMHEEILRKKEELDREKRHRHLFRFQHMGMWTKLRPGIWNFLEKASKLYELHLYTMGNHLYATEMAKVLDPTGELFAGRVISKGDENELLDGDERLPKTKDLEGVMGMESAVVIIDDSVKVWPHNRLNLIVVERYTYFPCSRRQFGLMGPSLLEIDHDERPEDGTLASSSAVIERIHQNFFSYASLNSVDVRNLLAAEQRKILANCRIVFSRIFPVGEANPHLHPLWQTAEQFGAVCTNQIDDQVTHVVANSLGTDKVNWALSTGRYVVHHGWVEASALLYQRANEKDFAVKP